MFTDLKIYFKSLTSKQKALIGSGIALALALIFALLYFVPVSLHANIKNETIYEGEDVFEEDLDVYKTSILGRRSEFKNYTCYKEKEGEVIVVGGRRRTSAKYEPIKIKREN